MLAHIWPSNEFTIIIIKYNILFFNIKLIVCLTVKTDLCARSLPLWLPKKNKCIVNCDVTHRSPLAHSLSLSHLKIYDGKLIEGHGTYFGPFIEHFKVEKRANTMDL